MKYHREPVASRTLRSVDLSDANGTTSMYCMCSSYRSRYWGGEQLAIGRGAPVQRPVRMYSLPAPAEVIEGQARWPPLSQHTVLTTTKYLGT